MAVNELVKNALNEIKYRHNLRQSEIAEKLGVKPTYLSDVVNGRAAFTDNLRSNVMRNFPNTSTLMAEESSYKDGGSSRDDAKTTLDDSRVRYAAFSAPREKGLIRYWLDIQATGGGLVSFSDSDTNRFIDIRIPEFRDCSDAINLYGDSMYPRYKSGQIIILKQWQENFVEFGNVYLIVTKNGHRMVKILRAFKDDSASVMCVSQNPDFDPFPIEKDDILELYIVKGSIEKAVL